MSAGYTTILGTSFRNILFDNAQTFNTGAVNNITNLLTYNIPANTLSKNNQSIQGTIIGQFSNTVGTDYQLYLYFDSGIDIVQPIIIPLNANSRFYNINFTLTRASSTSLVLISNVQVINNGTYTILNSYQYLNEFSPTNFLLGHTIKLDSTNASVGTVNGVITKEYANFYLQG